MPKQVPGSMSRIKSSGNKIFYTIQSDYDVKTYKYYYSLICFDGKGWKEIDNTGRGINVNDFDIDRNGNIWVASDSALWKYDWNNWQKFIVNDSFALNREYRRLCIDSSGNILIATNTSFIDFQSGGNKILKVPIYHELFKFDGKNFGTLVYKADSSLYGLESDYGLITSPDGKVYAHDPISLSNDLIIFDGLIQTRNTIYNPHYTSKPLFRWLSQIYQDKYGRVWFSFLEGFNKDPGLTVLHQDGSWETISKGYPRSVAGIIEDYKDSAYLECNAIIQDNDNKIWIGGNHFFGFLDEQFNLKIPDNEFYNNCILYGSDFWGIAKTDSARKAYLWSITHYNPKDPLTSASLNTKLLGFAVTTDGSLWFLLNNFGILRYNPNGVMSVLSEVLNRSDVLIYPQPLPKRNGYVNLSLREESQTCNIRLYSAIGSLVLEKKFDATSRQMQFPLPNSILPGCYFCEIRYNGRLICKKVLITD